MSIETLLPATEQEWLNMRKNDVTSTEVAALFGCNPYMTHFELWHRKHDNLAVVLEQNERMKWGNRLQDAIAAGVAEEQGWGIRRMTEYIHDPELKLGASFDFEFTVKASGEKGILEIKNVDGLAFRDGWLVEGENVEAPPHIEIQVQTQIALKGCDRNVIGALIGGNRLVMIEREPDFGVIAEIKNRVRKFWTSIADNQPPAPDFAKDAEFISKLYGYADPGKVLGAEGDQQLLSLALQYKEASEKAAAADKAKKAAKAEILTLIGTAEKVIGQGFSISAGMVGPKHVEYDAEGYRNWRINWKKEK